MVMESNLGQRLRLVMEEGGLSYEQLGDLLGMNPQTLNRYVLGQREPKAKTATAMAVALGVAPLWLQGYDVPRSAAANEVTPHREVAIPIVGTIRAGMPCVAHQEIEGYGAADVSNPEDYFYLRVKGDSMVNAGIREGDLVLLHRQRDADHGQIVACLLEGEEATLKRFRIQGDMAILQPENPAYDPRLVPLKHFSTGEALIVGVATKLVRDL